MNLHSTLPPATLSSFLASLWHVYMVILQTRVRGHAHLLFMMPSLNEMYKSVCLH